MCHADHFAPAVVFPASFGAYEAENLLDADACAVEVSSSSALLPLIGTWFADGWFTAEDFGARLALAFPAVDADAAPHMPYLIATESLHRLQGQGFDGSLLQASEVMPQLWRLAPAMTC